MNPNSLKNLKPVRKGDPGRNPLGGHAHNPEKRALKQFTNKYLVEVINLAVMGNLKGLQDIVSNPDSPAIQVGVAKSLFNAISRGDWGVLESIVTRIIGKVPDKIDHTSNGNTISMPVLKVEFGKKE